MKNSFLIFVILVWGSSVCAQTVTIAADTLTWNSSSNINLHTNEVFAHKTTFVTYDSTRVEMIIDQQVSVLDITHLEGQWDDPATIGILIYQVNYYGTPGTLTIERVPFVGLSLILDLSGGSETGMKQKFLIQSFSRN
jgi:hypothetical protein